MVKNTIMDVYIPIQHKMNSKHEMWSAYGLHSMLDYVASIKESINSGTLFMLFNIIHTIYW